jgi:carboxyl-terminal processing protease
MKLKVISSIGLVLIVISSCKKLTEISPATKPTPVETGTIPTTETSPYAEVNNWIYSQMKTYYFWETDMPTSAKSDLKLKPEAYFESLLNKPGEVDRFSWIQASATDLVNSLNGINKVYGIRSAQVFADAAKTKVAISVVYTLKGSPADKAGLKRGDFITQVDGKDLTPANASTVFANENGVFTLGEYKNGEIINTTKKLSIAKDVHTTEAVQYADVIKVGDRKIGYLLYIQFITSSDAAVRAAFKKFKDEGVNELVLDFRYNGGGFVSSSNIISSLAVKNLKPGSLMSRQEWNAAITKQQKDRYGASVFDTFFLNEANNIGNNLNRVYVITSKSTASASELVINNLKPFMPVILVGDNTYGKHVGSITLQDDKKRWDWGMQPITFRTVNAEGKADYGTKDGFIPTVRETDNVLPLKPYGDINETMLKAVLKHMGVSISTPAARVSTGKRFEMLKTRYFAETEKQELNDMFAPLPTR